MKEELNISAKAHVKLTKIDDKGHTISVEEHESNLTEEEAQELWRLQQKV
jgi:hypothetical protein